LSLAEAKEYVFCPLRTIANKTKQVQIIIRFILNKERAISTCESNVLVIENNFIILLFYNFNVTNIKVFQHGIKRKCPLFSFC